MKYLQRFKTHPRGDQWNLGQMAARGTTVVEPDGSEWRVLVVDIPPVDPQNVTRGVVIELKDIVFFRSNFFPDGAEVLMYVPRPSEKSYTLRLWSRIENAVLPASEGKPRASSVIAEA